MARDKGRSGPKQNFPHIVEITVPFGGLGRRLDAMHNFCAECGIRGRALTHRKGGEFYIRWCFAYPAMAAAFVAEFGGTILQ